MSSFFKKITFFCCCLFFRCSNVLATELNAFITTNANQSNAENYLKSKTGNPVEVLGKRKDLTPEKMAKIAEIFKNAGATILGGCCETRPAHIKELSKLAK